MEAEAERDKLLEELKGGHGIGSSESEDVDEMFDFSGMQTMQHELPRGFLQSVHLFHMDTLILAIGKHIHLFIFVTWLSEKLLSKQSRACPAEVVSTSNGAPDSAQPSPAPADPGPDAELRKQIEELTSQNSELALKVQVNSGKISNHQLRAVKMRTDGGKRFNKSFPEVYVDKSLSDQSISHHRFNFMMLLSWALTH